MESARGAPKEKLTVFGLYKTLSAASHPEVLRILPRECHLGDELAKELIKKIRELPEGKLKSLDLYGNKLTPAIMEDVSGLLEESKTL